METNETMVEQTVQADVADAQEEQLTETQDASESLDSIMEEDKPAAEEPPKEDSPSASEPGWFQRRWNKERDKLSEQIRAEVRSEYEAQFAPMRERLIEMDAKELVAQGVVKDLEVAKELIRYRQGQGAAPRSEQPKPVDRPRNEKGQFSSQNPKDDPAIQARIDMLSHQADSIKAKTGVDVIAVFNSNPEIKQKVISGKMDFYDVASGMNAEPQKKGRPPAPVRTPNGASGSEKSTIASMSKEQFARLEKKIAEGGRFEI